MKQLLIGAGVSMLATSAGFLFWQSWAQPEALIPPPPPPALPEAPPIDPLTLPTAGPGAPRFGAAPPTLPAAAKEDREVQRFNRYDRNRDELISRIELLSSRTKDFKKLDKDGNNLLTFEEWASATAARFAKADANRNLLLTRIEFATTKPRRKAKPVCRCDED